MSTTSQTATTEYSVTTVVTSDGVTLYGGNAIVSYQYSASGTHTAWYSSLSALCQAHPEYEGAPADGEVKRVGWEWNREQ
jgi:hypothetical protein